MREPPNGEIMRGMLSADVGCVCDEIVGGRAASVRSGLIFGINLTIVMTMVAKIIPASVFKAKCLAMMDEVARTGEPVVITKNGKPVAQLAPAGKDLKARRPAFGMHRGLVYPIRDVDLDEPVIDPAAWTADEENLGD